MKKVFFDIGTNLLQGFRIVADKLDLNEKDWTYVFVEPNPDFIGTAEHQQILAMPNAVFYPYALYDGNEPKSEASYFKRKQMDDGGNIFDLNGQFSCTVPTISIKELTKDFIHDELYFKFDCEYAEYDSVPKLLDLNLNIAKIFCEFHYNAESYENHLVVKEGIIKMIKDRHIEFEEWQF